MKVVHSKHPLPRIWKGLKGADKALMIADIFVTRYSRLRLKLLVFEKRLHMRRFSSAALGINGLSRNAAGFVKALGHEVYKPHKDGSRSNYRIEVDPRFFAVMCLCIDSLSMEVITHESVHAGCAYANRVKHRDFWPNQINNDEEAICYPTGLIAAHVNTALADAGMYKLYFAACAAYKREQERKKRKK